MNTAPQHTILCFFFPPLSFITLHYYVPMDAHLIYIGHIKFPWNLSTCISLPQGRPAIPLKTRAHYSLVSWWAHNEVFPGPPARWKLGFLATSICCGLVAPFCAALVLLPRPPPPSIRYTTRLQTITKDLLLLATLVTSRYKKFQQAIW